MNLKNVDLTQFKWKSGQCNNNGLYTSKNANKAVPFVIIASVINAKNIEENGHYGSYAMEVNADEDNG
jgi:hypothetical protein